MIFIRSKDLVHSEIYCQWLRAKASTSISPFDIEATDMFPAGVVDAALNLTFETPSCLQTNYG